MDACLRRTIPLLLLCFFAFAPLPALAESGVLNESVEQMYAVALDLFERSKEGDIARARAIFTQCKGYEDSARYIDYIDAANALITEDFAAATQLLGTLSALNFLDARTLFPYARARREEAAGNFMHAILLYREMDTRDSFDRLIALRLAHSEYFPAVGDRPRGAVDGGYAVVMEDMLPVWTKPGGGEQMDAHPRFTRLQTLAFAYAGDGSLWACVLQPDVFSYHDERYSDDIFGFVPAAALHYTDKE